MNQDNPKVPELKPLKPQSPRPVHDVSFKAPEVKDYTAGANQPVHDPVRRFSVRDRVKSMHKKINNSRWKGFISAAQLVLGSIFLALFINHFIFQSYQVYGLSMTPTLHDGDRLIISKVGKSISELTGSEYLPKRGEIIVFHNPRNAESPQLIKRVIALPGERVVVENGNITIYNAEHPDGFEPDQIFGLQLDITVGRVDLVVTEGEIFVSGDNRGQGGSLDSRNELGTVPTDLIVGELVMRIIPVTDAQVF